MAIRPNLWSPGMVEPDGRLSRTLIDYLNTLGDTTSAGLAASIAAVDARVTALAAVPFNINGTPHQITLLGDATTGIAISIAYDYPGQTSIATLGTITVGTWNGTVIGPTFGGTGLSSYTAGDLIYATATNVLGKLAAGTNGYALRMVAGAPAWAETVAESVTNGVTGIAPSQDAVFDAIAALSSVYQPLDTQLTSLSGLTYGSNALKVVRVNAGETAFELATVSGGGSTPTGTGFTHIIAGVQDAAAKLVDVTDISVTSEAQGDILYRGASGWARLGAGTSGHFLKTQGAAADPVWAAASGGSASAGYQIGYAYTISTTQATTTSTTIPFDNTIPQNTEGAAFASLDTTYTVQEAASLLVVRVTLHIIGHSASGANIPFAVFRDSTANAIVATLAPYTGGANSTNQAPVILTAVVAAGSTGATTFKLRWSAGGSGTAYINTYGNTAYFGNAHFAVMEVMEIKQ